MSDESIKEIVKQKYGLAALRVTSGESGCCDTASSRGACDPITSKLYEAGETATLPAEAVAASLGCGNPTLLAELHPGEVVLDLGSGGGLDVLLSAQRVAPGGHAYGVDMTDEMLELADRNREQSGVENASFLKGTIDQVPLPDASVDVVISNCVINLAEDKGAVIREAFRVLRPGGRLAVSDMVELRPLPAVVKVELDAWAGCVAGTI